MNNLKRKVKILQKQLETLDRGMFKLHYRLIKEGINPGDDLYILAGFEFEILAEILSKTEKIIEKGVPKCLKNQ